MISELLRVPPGTDVQLDLQEQLYAGARHGSPARVLVGLQGMETSGKGGAVRKVAGQVNPAGVRITGFGKPTEEERARDVLWRIDRALPTPGRIGLFGRSHYETSGRAGARPRDAGGVGAALRPDQRLGGRSGGAGRRAAQGDAAALPRGAGDIHERAQLLETLEGRDLAWPAPELDLDGMRGALRG